MQELLIINSVVSILLFLPVFILIWDNLCGDIFRYYFLPHATSDFFSSFFFFGLLNFRSIFKILLSDFFNVLEINH